MFRAELAHEARTRNAAEIGSLLGPATELRRYVALEYADHLTAAHSDDAGPTSRDQRQDFDRQVKEADAALRSVTHAATRLAVTGNDAELSEALHGLVDALSTLTGWARRKSEMSTIIKLRSDRPLEELEQLEDDRNDASAALSKSAKEVDAYLSKLRDVGARMADISA
ncbi:MAG: hypothetical protein AAGA65_17940 [Actinomycetota bacterium]